MFTLIIASVISIGSGVATFRALGDKSHECKCDKRVAVEDVYDVDPEDVDDAE